jgi:hypothetical protein
MLQGDLSGKANGVVFDAVFFYIVVGGVHYNIHCKG